MCTASIAHGADARAQVGDAPLVRLAAAKFTNLTRAERALLEFVQVGRVERGQFAVAGTSANPDNPSNDPKGAVQWGKVREIRAQLIRWLCVDPDAVKMVDPLGIRILGARIIGALDLFNARVPFGLTLRRCAIPEPMNLSLAAVASLDLGGSYTNEIDAKSLAVLGDIDMNRGFRASGWVELESASIDGDLNCAGGSFTHSKDSENGFWAAQMPALSMDGIRIKGTAWLCCGFRSDGGVMLSEATVRDLECFAGRFINPGKYALALNGTDISGFAVLGKWTAFGKNWGGLESDGLVMFINTKVGAYFRAEGVRFIGKSTEPHGLMVDDLSAGSIFLTGMELQNGATLDLRGASTGALIDDEKSWPQPGRLQIDGFTYSGLWEPDTTKPSPSSTRSHRFNATAAGNAEEYKPSAARSRLRWLGLQDGFHPQPYRQLAKVLREGGDDAGAIEVLIAQQDAHFRNSNWLVRAWAQFLKITVAYGYRPLRTVLWSLAVILLGRIVVAVGARAGVMRLTWPETTPPPAGDPTAGLHPLLYSLDVFLPLVNLHQEHYWWPDESASGEYRLLGRDITIRGSILRYYLWLQIIAGWLLSAIFIAGVTGLMHND